jgi:uncharacterized membrane protein
MRTQSPHVIEMPSWRSLARHAGRTVLIVSVLPMLIFMAAYRIAGLHAAIAAAMTWYYLGLAVRFARGSRVLVAMIVGAAIVTIRAVTTWLTGSAVVYFLQPVAATVAMATAMAVTALAGRPMLDRLAHEFCPFPDELSHRLRRGRFFTRLSFVWASAYIVNAAGTVWLLSASSLGGFIVLKSVLSPVLTGVAMVFSYALLRLTLHRDGVRIRFAAAR